MGFDDPLAARIALLDEMLAKAADEERGAGHEFWCGFYTAKGVITEWKGLTTPKAHDEKPLDMPMIEEGIGA